MSGQICGSIVVHCNEFSRWSFSFFSSRRMLYLVRMQYPLPNQIDGLFAGDFVPQSVASQNQEIGPSLDGCSTDDWLCREIWWGEQSLPNTLTEVFCFHYSLCFCVPLPSSVAEAPSDSNA